jgi:hypothetical protein
MLRSRGAQEGGQAGNIFCCHQAAGGGDGKGVFDDVFIRADVVEVLQGIGQHDAGGNGVDDDILWSKLNRQVADDGFDSGFAGAHDNVIGQDTPGARAGNGDQRAALAFCHQGHSALSAKQQRAGVDVAVSPALGLCCMAGRL